MFKKPMTDMELENWDDQSIQLKIWYHLGLRSKILWLDPNVSFILVLFFDNLKRLMSMPSFAERIKKILKKKMKKNYWENLNSYFESLIMILFKSSLNKSFENQMRLTNLSTKSVH